jgi:2,3-dihydroxybiphenyl 1,2-dioxygenase
LISQLGYLGLGVRDLAAWEKFAVEVLGLGVVDRAADGSFALRMDGHAQRIVVEPGDDDVTRLGWEVADGAALDGLAARLRAAGVELVEGTAGEAAQRRVERLVKLRDPSGLPLEICCGPALASEAFRSPVVRSGFVADERGLGHVVVSAHDQMKSVRFYTELLGFKLSDRIVADIHGYHADIVFLHANPRHHSLAIGGEQRKRIHHFMLEVRAMDEVGLAFDRTLRSGARIMQTLGRHPNDRMFSFYAKTPSGFQFEYGWGGREIDDATWQPTTYDCISEWGHHPPQFLVPK